MNKIVKILMKRDNMTREDAEDLVKETRDLLLKLKNPCEADYIIQDQLDLEPDYLFDILDI